MFSGSMSSTNLLPTLVGIEIEIDWGRGVEREVRERGERDARERERE